VIYIGFIRKYPYLSRMKRQENEELDVDFIGGQEPLTEEEERLIHDYFQSKKETIAEDETSPKGYIFITAGR
jgi:hypothetical protein